MAAHIVPISIGLLMILKHLNDLSSTWLKRKSILAHDEAEHHQGEYLAGVSLIMIMLNNIDDDEGGDDDDNDGNEDNDNKIMMTMTIDMMIA